ncbi:hypothetical protein DMUE_4199 [Dictyocoela muelleri]|nr:hypothetical protein DMUE_4199 [Dictyocoela muelleri]
MCSVCTLGIKCHNKRNKDLYAWRCMKTVILITIYMYLFNTILFFTSFSIGMDVIFRIIIIYLTKKPLHSILSYFMRPRTVYRVISEFDKLIPAENFQNNKIDGPERLIQLDETMLNFKEKSHIWRYPSNRTDAICIV